MKKKWSQPRYDEWYELFYGISIGFKVVNYSLEEISPPVIAKL